MILAYNVYRVRCTEFHLETEAGWHAVATNVFDAAANSLSNHWTQWETANVRVTDNEGEVYLFRCFRNGEVIEFDLERDVA